MIFNEKKITLKNGQTAVLKTPCVEYAEKMLDYITKACGEIKYLLRYPGTSQMDFSLISRISNWRQTAIINSWLPKMGLEARRQGAQNRCQPCATGTQHRQISAQACMGRYSPHAHAKKRIPPSIKNKISAYTNYGIRHPQAVKSIDFQQLL